MGSRKIVYLIIIFLIISCSASYRAKKEYLKSYPTPEKYDQKRYNQIKKLHKKENKKLHPNQKCSFKKC